MELVDTSIDESISNRILAVYLDEALLLLFRLWME